VLLTLNLVRDSGGLPQRLFAVAVDINERKLAEQELVEREGDLRQARDELERRVVERTAELAEANDALLKEISERRTAEEQVRELLGRLVQVVEEERARISRDLHDTLGQHLAVLTLELKTLQGMAMGAAGARERIASIQRSVRMIDDEVDRLSYELRPVALDDLGLDEALRSHARNWSAESGIAVDVHSHGLRTGRLPAVVETTVYRIVQEALTNVRKHAGASRVGLIAERRLDEVRVVIEDDGCGFDPAGVSSVGGRRLGLRGMSERAGLVAGRLEIESLPGRGTTVYLAIPVHTDVEGDATAAGE
jgi:signal transduction histidine kinase